MVVRLLVMLSTRPWSPHTREMKWVPGPSAATTPPPPPPSKPMARQKGDYPGLVTSAFLSSLPPLLLTSLNETNPAPAQHPPGAWRPHATQPIGGVNLSELFSHQLLWQIITLDIITFMHDHSMHVLLLAISIYSTFSHFLFTFQLSEHFYSVLSNFSPFTGSAWQHRV